MLQKLTILDQTDSLLNHFTAELRDREIQKDGARFRKNLERIGEVMAYEISKSFDYNSTRVTTPLGEHSVSLMNAQPVLVTILRAGIPLYQGFLNFFDKSRSGFMGAKRSEPKSEIGNMVDAIDVDLSYQAVSEIHDRPVILIDPMLATGNSMAESIERLLKHGKPLSLHVAVVIASPEGVEQLKRRVPIDFNLWIVSLDQYLDENAFIYPGLGDAGDLAFGDSKTS